MSVFEKKKDDRLLIDDTKPLVFKIKDAQEIGGHIEYTFEVWRIPDVEARWTVSHRYSDFTQLHTALKFGTTALPPLPPKRVFGNTDRNFINERKEALQIYLDVLVSNPLFAGSLLLRRFLDPENYSGNLLEEARQNVQQILRSGGNHEITEPLPSIGTRFRKQYFLARSLADPKTSTILWWAPYGPDRRMNIRDIHATLTALVQCQHPNIVSAISSVATESGVCVLRNYFPQGTMRDMLHGAKPQMNFLTKYMGQQVAAFSEKDCAVYARQILQTLLFLHEKGFGHGNLHTGNLVIENNTCRLLDLENQVIGLPCELRPFISQHRRINSPESIDVYCFGHVLYELALRKRLNTDTCDEFPLDCPPLCRSVLESILSSEACKNGLPTVAGLLTHPFVSQVPLHSLGKPTFRLPSNVKQAVSAAQEFTITRLAVDQKKIRRQKKINKAEATISQPSRKTSKPKLKSNETNGTATPESDYSGDSVQRLHPQMINKLLQ